MKNTEKPTNELLAEALGWNQEDTDELLRRNTVPEEKWLEVDSHIDIARMSEDPLVAVANLGAALRYLYLLLEPPSVRERRLDNA